MYAYCAWHVLLSCSRTTEIQAVHGDVQAVKGGPVHELLEKVPGAPARHPIIYCSEGGGEEKERERETTKKAGVRRRTHKGRCCGSFGCSMHSWPGSGGSPRVPRCLHETNEKSCGLPGIFVSRNELSEELQLLMGMRCPPLRPHISRIAPKSSAGKQFQPRSSTCWQNSDQTSQDRSQRTQRLPGGSCCEARARGKT